MGKEINEHQDSKIAGGEGSMMQISNSQID
jgi:hypothetical protein